MSRIGNSRRRYEKLATLRRTSQDPKDWAGRDKTSLHLVIFRRIFDQIWRERLDKNMRRITRFGGDLAPIRSWGSRHNNWRYTDPPREKGLLLYEISRYNVRCGVGALSISQVAVTIKTPTQETV